MPNNSLHRGPQKASGLGKKDFIIERASSISIASPFVLEHEVDGPTRFVGPYTQGLFKEGKMRSNGNAGSVLMFSCTRVFLFWPIVQTYIFLA